MINYKRLALLLILVLVALPAQSVQAGGDWFAYLYNSETQELLRVHLSGEIETVPVSFDEAAYLGAYEMTFSKHGDYMAYCFIKSAEDGSQQATLVVWQLDSVMDTNSATQLYEIDLGYSIGCRVGHPGINSDQTLLAVGLVHYFPGDPDADATLPPWSLQVFDLKTGDLLHELNPTTPGFTQVPGFEAAPLMPDVVYFEEIYLVFRHILWGMGGASMTMPSYSWNLTDETVGTVENYGAVALDYLTQTGELAWMELDTSLPAASPSGPMPQINVVNLSDKTGNPPRTIYYTADDVISDVQFIDGGQRIAIQLVAPFDPNAPADQGVAARWIGLDREGQVTDLETDILTYTEVHYGPGGYLYFLQSYEDITQYTGASYTLEYVWSDGSRHPLWEADGQQWEYAWGMGWNVQPDLGSFPEVALP